MKILAWISLRWKLHSLSKARRMVVKWEYESSQCMKLLDRKEKQLDLLIRTLEQLKVETEVELANAKRIEKQSQTTIEALRNENEVLSLNGS